jgi:hypothetical protein
MAYTAETFEKILKCNLVEQYMLRGLFRIKYNYTK